MGKPQQLLAISLIVIITTFLRIMRQQCELVIYVNYYIKEKPASRPFTDEIDNLLKFKHNEIKIF